jgi:hypothetical protein
MLLHDTLVVDDEPVPAWRHDAEAPLPRLRPATPPARKRVRVRRPEQPELPDRWRVRPPGADR